MKKANENEHPVRIILRDWSKAKKGNHPVAETHSRKETKKK